MSRLDLKERMRKLELQFAEEEEAARKREKEEEEKVTKAEEKKSKEMSEEDKKKEEEEEKKFSERFTRKFSECSKSMEERMMSMEESLGKVMEMMESTAKRSK